MKPFLKLPVSYLTDFYNYISFLIVLKACCAPAPPNASSGTKTSAPPKELVSNENPKPISSFLLE